MTCDIGDGVDPRGLRTSILSIKTENDYIQFLINACMGDYEIKVIGNIYENPELLEKNNV